MESKWKFELDDEVLDAVAGGAGTGTFTNQYNGHAVSLVSSRCCSKCGGSKAILMCANSSKQIYTGVCNNSGCGGDMGLDAESVLLKRPCLGSVYEDEVVADYGAVLY